MTTTERNEMPPHLLGLDDQARAARLTLAIVDGDRSRYDAAMADALGHGPELIYALARNWYMQLVEHHGAKVARDRIVRILVGIQEHHEELRVHGHLEPPSDRVSDADRDDEDEDEDEPW